MFDLDAEVIAWCRKVHRHPRWRAFDRQARIDELADHVYCEVARLTDEGASEVEAFRIATERLGDATDLGREHRKELRSMQRTLSVLGAVCTVCSGHRRLARERLTPAQASAWLIGISLAFAAVMVGTAIVRNESNSTLVWILIAMWWVPFSALSGVAEEGRRSRCRE